MSTNLCILPDEFRSLLVLCMCADPAPAGCDLDAVKRLLDQVAKNYGYEDWIVAYHSLVGRTD